VTYRLVNNPHRPAELCRQIQREIPVCERCKKQIDSGANIRDLVVSADAVVNGKLAEVKTAAAKPVPQPVASVPVPVPQPIQAEKPSRFSGIKL
jgi:hypothetical protein